jgi:hypothetical protein
MKSETIPEPVNPVYLRLARDFENAAEANREARLHGAANDAEARKGVCEFLSRQIAAAA